jgi:hypothetical protein
LEDPDNFKFKTLKLPLLGDQELRLFGKKKTSPVQENTYEIFGGFTITKNTIGYEIKWKSPNLTVVTVRSPPVIDENVETKREGNKIYVLSKECKLRITEKEGSMDAKISKI